MKKKYTYKKVCNPVKSGDRGIKEKRRIAISKTLDKGMIQQRGESYNEKLEGG